MLLFIRRNKKEIIAAFFIAVAFFFLRLYQLRSVPLFNDEVINVRRAQLGAYDPSQRLFSLVDGKQPLYIWAISLVMYHIGNPLIAAKAVSILGGLLTAVMLYLLTLELFKNKWMGLVSMALYTFYPFAVLTNRQVLFENFVGLLSVVSLYFAVHLVRDPNLGTMFLLAHSMGAAILTKSSGFFNIYLLPVTAILIHKRNAIGKWAAYAMSAVFFAYLYYSVIYLSPYANSVDAKNNIFIYSVRELIPNYAFAKWPGQFVQFSWWVIQYFAVLPIIPLFFVWKSKKYRKEILVLFFWFFLPFAAFTLFAKLPYPRHLFAMTLTLIPLIALALWEVKAHLKSPKKLAAMLGVILFSMVYTDAKLLTDFAHAPIPQLDLFQYVNGWPAGGGMKEIISYLTPIAAQEQIFIVTEGGFGYGGLATASLDIYFANNPNVTKVEVNDVPFVVPDEVLADAADKPVYVLLNRYQGGLDTPADLILKFRKGTGDSFIRLYQFR